MDNNLGQFTNKSITSEGTAEYNSRFKYKTRDISLLKEQIQLNNLQQHQIMLNSQFAAPNISQNVNQSMILQGTFNQSNQGQIITSKSLNPYNPLNLGSQSVERISGKALLLPKIVKKGGAIFSLNLNNNDMITGGEGNIFANEDEMKNEVAYQHLRVPEESTPKTPIKTINDQESHISSINQNLDPVYDPNKVNGLASIQGTQLYPNKNSENVFASLQSQEEAHVRPMNLSMQTSGTILAEGVSNFYSNMPSQILGSQNQIFPPTFGQTLISYNNGGTAAGLVNSRNLVNSNPGFQIYNSTGGGLGYVNSQNNGGGNTGNIFMSQQNNGNIFGNKQTGRNNQQVMNWTKTTRRDINQQVAQENSQSQFMNKRGKSTSNVAVNQSFMVRQKVMSPPRALQRDVERHGFKGQVVKKKEKPNEQEGFM